MPKTSPWHSVKQGDPPVYHDNTECDKGNNIESENVRQGTGGRRRCDRCQELDDQGR